MLILTHQADEEDLKGNELSCDISSSEPDNNTNMIFVLLGHNSLHILFNVGLLTVRYWNQKHI